MVGVSERHGAYACHVDGPRQNPLLHLAHLFHVPILPNWKVHAHTQDALRLDADADVGEVLEALEQQAGPDRQHERNRDLTHHEHVAESATEESTRDGATPILEHRPRVYAGGPEAWHEAHEDDRAQGDGSGERENAEIQAHLADAGNATRIEALHESDRAQCHTHTRYCPNRGEHSRLDHQRPGHLTRGSAEGAAQCNLRLSVFSPHEEQVGHVDARDQKHSPDGDEQHHQRSRSAPSPGDCRRRTPREGRCVRVGRRLPERRRSWT